MAEYGIVRFFDSRKQFGFVKVIDGDGRETKEEVFFHYKDGKIIVDWEGSTPIFSGTPEPPEQPKKGDILVFDRFPSAHKKYEKARPWGFAGGRHPRLELEAIHPPPYPGGRHRPRTLR